MRLHEKWQSVVTPDLRDAALAPRVSKSLRELLGSRNLATLLLLLFIVLSALGTLIPQESLYPREEFLGWKARNPLLAPTAISLGLTRLFTSPAYLIIAWLLAVSVGFCTWQRVASGLKAIRQPLPSAETLRRFAHVQLLQSSLSAAEMYQRATSPSIGRGLRLTRLDQQSRVFKGERGRAGFWGSILFHLSFLVILAGALLSTWTRFEGKILLTEGESFSGATEAYLKGSILGLLPPESLDFNLTLEKLTLPRTSSEGPRSQVRIEQSDGDRFTHQVGNFHALSHKGYVFYQKEHGYSPSFKLSDAWGNTIFHGFVAFKSRDDLGEKRIEDAFVIPRTNLRLEGRLIPETGDSAPLMDFQLLQGGQPLYRGSLPLFESAVFGGGAKVSFDRLRYWTAFRVVRDQGIPVLYTGFFLGILGLALRLFCVREEIWGVVEDNGEGATLVLAGRAEGGNALFAERFQSLAEKLKNQLISSGN